MLCIYYSGVWGYNKHDCLNKVFYSAIRYFLGVHRFCPLLALLGKMGWVLPQYKRFIKMVLLWNRLCKMPNNRVTKQLFLYDYERSRYNWSDEIKKLLLLLIC